MRVVHFVIPDQGLRIGVVDGEEVLDLTRGLGGARSTLAVLEQAHAEGKELEGLLAPAIDAAKDRWRYVDLDRPPVEGEPHLVAPILPPEVWGAGLTYVASAEFRSEEMRVGGRFDVYDHAHQHSRPELFFKATASRCVGPNDTVAVRSDSVFTVPEPELAAVLGSDGSVLAYTICNDVSAWDIERENPLFLPQSKIFDGCCALGPALVSCAQMGNIADRSLRCRIARGKSVLYDRAISIRQMRRSLQELIQALCLDNPIPTGTVLTTGTGIVVPEQFALQEGDTVEIILEPIGTLRNGVRRLGLRRPAPERSAPNQAESRGATGDDGVR